MKFSIFLGISICSVILAMFYMALGTDEIVENILPSKKVVVYSSPMKPYELPEDLPLNIAECVVEDVRAVRISGFYAGSASGAAPVWSGFAMKLVESMEDVADDVHVGASGTQHDPVVGVEHLVIQEPDAAGALVRDHDHPVRGR